MEQKLLGKGCSDGSDALGEVMAPALSEGQSGSLSVFLSVLFWTQAL